MMRRALFLPLGVALTCSTAHAQWKPGVALARDGARLMYDGKPFAAVGVNKHELLDQYTAELQGSTPDEAAAARVAAKR